MQIRLIEANKAKLTGVNIYRIHAPISYPSSPNSASSMKWSIKVSFAEFQPQTAQGHAFCKLFYTVGA